MNSPSDSALPFPVEQRLQAILANALVGIGFVDRDMRWLEVNPTLCRILGYRAAALRQLRLRDIIHPDDRALSVAGFQSALQASEDEHNVNRRCLHQDGSVIETAISARAIRGPDGAVACFAIVLKDITERRDTERQLARQMERAGILLELPRIAERLDEPDFMRHALDHACGLTASQYAGVALIDEDGGPATLLCAPENCAPLLTAAHFAAMMHYREPQILDLAEFLTVDAADAPETNRDAGTAAPSFICVPVLEDDKLRLLAVVGGKREVYAAFDVETVQLIANATWRIVHERRIDAALQLATHVLNASTVVCFRWAARAGWPVVFVSENVSQWGYSTRQLQAGDPPFAALVHPDDLERVVEEVRRHTAEGASGYEQEYRLITGDQRVIWVVDRTVVQRAADGSVRFYDGVLTDISERKAQQLLLAENLQQQQQLNKRLEEANNQLLQSEKMASIGQLAAGVAHELNNPIGFVHSNLGTLEGYLHDLMAIIEAYEALCASAAPGALEDITRLKDERDYDYVKNDLFSLIAESRDGLARLRKIVLDLKNFARTGEQEWKEADLQQGLESTLNIVWNELKYRCDVVRDYAPLPPVECLISQLNQVFMNLLVNAGQAIEQRGTITLRTRQLDADHVCIEVEDSGKGIAPEHLNRIFDPFFTTKPIGTGTGLGLSLSYGIVQRHHGRIEVSSQPGAGSCFRVVLPLHQPKA